MNRTVIICMLGASACAATDAPGTLSSSSSELQLCPDFDRTNRDISFCNDPDCPCQPAEGDCDSTDQCVTGSLCIDNIGAAIGFPSTDDLCWRNDQLVWFTDEQISGGVWQALPVGRWDVGDLTIVGNDRIRRVSPNAGYVTHLYAEAGCWGDSLTVTTYSSWLGKLDRRTSCLDIVPGVTLYRNHNFGGATQTFEGGVYNATAMTGIGNDQAESLKAAPGVLARLCSESGGWGTCQTFSGAVGSLGLLDNSASYVQVSYGATVYVDRGFGGVSQTFGIGSWPVTSLITVGNDSISSIIVAPGMQATLCSENGGWGTCKTFRGSYSFVGSDLDDRTSNIVVSAIP